MPSVLPCVNWKEPDISCAIRDAIKVGGSQIPSMSSMNSPKGTPQGGIISPLLANIVLNELDKWVESQWQNHPLVKEYGYERKIRNSITFDRSKAFSKS